MSLFGWLCEIGNMGPIGTVRVGRPVIPRRSKGLILFRFLVACFIIGIVCFFMFQNQFGMYMKSIFIVYCVLAFFVRPQSDTSNLGLFGGLVDNPFKISDTLNRAILLFQIILFPGMFVSESIVQVLKLFKGSSIES